MAQDRVAEVRDLQLYVPTFLHGHASRGRQAFNPAKRKKHILNNFTPPMLSSSNTLRNIICRAGRMVQVVKHLPMRRLELKKKMVKIYNL
jgi:hypothetical protein